MQLFNDFITPGVLTSSDLQVTQASTPNLSVNVNGGPQEQPGGNAWLPGGYRLWNDSVLNLPIATPDPNNPRIDVVVAGINTATNPATPTIEIITGTAASSPAPPAVPTGWIELAQINVPAAATQITNANIIDTRTYAGIKFDHLQAVNQNNPLMLPNLAGLPTVVGPAGTLVLANGQVFVSNGTSWVAQTPPGASTSTAGIVEVADPPSGQYPVAITTDSAVYKVVHSGTYITAGTGLSSTSGTNSQTLALNPAGATLGGVTLPPSAGTPTNPVAVYRAVSVKDMTITSTSSTTVLSYTPAATGQFKVSGYLRVANAATIVTVTLTYTSPSGSQTITLVPQYTLAVGDYTITATTFEATTAGPITLSVTAGTANNVTVSAVLEAV